MPTAQEYRQYAEECMESARTAPSREARKQCLDLARLWTRAAQKTDDGMSVPIEADASGPPRPHRSVVPLGMLWPRQSLEGCRNQTL